MNAALRFTRKLSQSTVGVALRKTLNKAFSSKYLLLTNVTLATGSACGGDLLAQYYELASGEEKEFDVKRNMKVSFTGTLSGPVFHYWYLTLDKFLPGKTARIVLSKVCLDMAIAAPTFIFIFIGSLAIMDGEKLSKVKSEIMEKGQELWLATLVVWPPASAFSFCVLPTRFRVVYESALALLLDGYFSYVRYRDHKEQQQSISQNMDGKQNAETENS